jgi:alkaline phosphatase D
LLAGLATAGGSWNVLADQVPFAPRDSDTNAGRIGFDLDQWDGYVADRQLVLDFLRDRGLLNRDQLRWRQHPHHLFSNNNRGYVRVLLDPAHWTSEFRIVATVRAQQATASTLATFMVDNGKPGAYAVSGSAV